MLMETTSPYRKTFEGAMYRSKVYFTRMGPKDHAQSKFLVIKKKKKKEVN
jgi:hypothetical protein